MGPTLSITRKSPVEATTNLAEVTFSLAFSEAVVNVDLTDFELSPNSVGGVIQSVISRSFTNYEVVVTEIAGDGEVNLDIKSTTDIQNGVGNRFSRNVTTDQTYTIENIITDINDPIAANLKLTVEENPSSGVFRVSLDFDAPLGINYNVTDIKGLNILSETKSNYKVDEPIVIDLNRVPNGVYLLRVETQFGFIITKLLKQSQ